MKILQWKMRIFNRKRTPNGGRFPAQLQLDLFHLHTEFIIVSRKPIDFCTKSIVLNTEFIVFSTEFIVFDAKSIVLNTEFVVLNATLTFRCTRPRTVVQRAAARARAVGSICQGLRRCRSSSVRLSTSPDSRRRTQGTSCAWSGRGSGTTRRAREAVAWVYVCMSGRSLTV